MPVTPFHFGPGVLAAAASRRRMSFLAFAAANVFIDVESLYNMLTEQPRIHTFFHTYAGSTLAAAATVVAFIACRRVAMKLPAWPVVAWRHLGVKAVLLGSLVGAWSHVLLDSVMHSDITPLAPFSQSNSLHGIVSLGVLHGLCIVSGVVGAVWCMLRYRISLARR